MLGFGFPEIIRYTRDGKRKAWESPCYNPSAVMISRFIYRLSGTRMSHFIFPAPALREAPAGTAALLFKLPGLAPNADCSHNSKGNLYQVLGKRPSREHFLIKINLFRV